MRRIESALDPQIFLRKQKLLSKTESGEYGPNVGCVLLFDEQPQAMMDTRCAIKLYRLMTSDAEYRREQLDGPPRTISGPFEKQIETAIRAIAEMLEGASYEAKGDIVKLKYPAEAIHEILVNAVIHWDYSLNDDIHVKVYDNRIEIQSPGRLPGYITVENIYEERFSRNPNLVRMLHNLPNPVNHDIGEGLDTARNELKKAGLVAPEIRESDNAVIITIRHQKLAPLIDIILEYLQGNPGKAITSKIVRELSGEDDVNKIKRAFQRLRRRGDIIPVDDKASAFDFKYVLAPENKGNREGKRGEGSQKKK
jgi:ATP-dependent DNA helicase RecG